MTLSASASISRRVARTNTGFWLVSQPGPTLDRRGRLHHLMLGLALGLFPFSISFEVFLFPLTAEEVKAHRERWVAEFLERFDPDEDEDDEPPAEKTGTDDA